MSKSEDNKLSSHKIEFPVLAAMSPNGREITGRLEGWSPQSSPALSEFIIWGEVYDDIHGRFPDGRTIHTSGIPVDELPNLRAGYVVETRNSNYLLGEELGNKMRRLIEEEYTRGNDDDG